MVNGNFAPCPKTTSADMGSANLLCQIHPTPISSSWGPPNPGGTKPRLLKNVHVPLL